MSLGNKIERYNYLIMLSWIGNNSMHLYSKVIRYIPYIFQGKRQVAMTSSYNQFWHVNS